MGGVVKGVGTKSTIPRETDRQEKTLQKLHHMALTHRHTHRQTDIATLRLNQPSGHVCSEFFTQPALKQIQLRCLCGLE